MTGTLLPTWLIVTSIIVTVGVALVAALPAQATPKYAKVVHVIDGDTVIIKHRFRETRIRLAGIDAPEAGQPYGIEATRYLEKLIGNKRVEIEVKQKNDRYKRVVANIYVTRWGKKGHTGHALLREGLAWADPRYATRDMKNLQFEALQKRRGLFVDRNAIAPWTWRKNKKKVSWWMRLWNVFS